MDVNQFLKSILGQSFGSDLDPLDPTGGFDVFADQVRHAYRKGYDCGRNGPTLVNTDYRLFDHPSKTKAWEEGKAKGAAARQAESN